MTLTIGVLALQGAVEEHMMCLQKLGCNTKEIKVKENIDDLHGIICPGGESTAMAVVGERGGLFPALRDWVQSGRPVWGTCAGMILLSDHAIKQASGGQSFIGGIDVHVCRNYFGSQVYSCEYDIQNVRDTKLAQSSGIFIRAPAIIKCGPGVEVLGTVNAAPHASALTAVQGLLQSSEVEATDKSLTTALSQPTTDNRVRDESTDGFQATPQPFSSLKNSGNSERQAGNEGADGAVEENVFQVAVAVRQGNILATAFHPELSNDLRWHRYFVEMVQANCCI